jgi:Leucine-rich repeat (LRR) protein
METLALHWKDEDPDLGIASEGVYCEDINDIIGRIEIVKNTVTKIILNNQPAFTRIPEILQECEQLEILDISYTPIIKIPEFLFSLPNLQTLSCCCSSLLEPPTGFSKATKLENLHIQINRGWTFPEEIASMQNLSVLAVDLFTYAALPEDLGSLDHLHTLSLSIKYDKGDIPSLPGSFNGHPVFNKLIINDTFYRKRKNFDLELAAGILSSCPNFEVLKLSGISVGIGHQNLSLLTGIKELELRHLIVEDNIFDSLAGLHNLEKLDIWGSEFKITKMPDIFYNINKLQKFSFAGNMILDLPPSIYELKQLKILEIGSTGISSLDENIVNLENLERLHIYDSILDKLPSGVFTLPNLKVLNIDENIFTASTITAIKETLDALAQQDKIIEFSHDGQGHRQMVKRLRALRNIDTMELMTYAKHCLNAINENPWALKYVNKNKIQGSILYAELCLAAAKKNCSVLEIIDTRLLAKGHYYFICKEAAKNQDIGNTFKNIKDEFLTDDEYILVCIEAALQNKSKDFLSYLNMGRLSREIYERISWVAVMNCPQAISKMEEPTPEIQEIAERRTVRK